MKIERVAVIGAGTMGHGIAQVLAAAGCQVALTDVSAAAVDAALAKIAASLDRFCQKGVISDGERTATLARLRPCLELAQLSDRQLVVEAASENETIKQSIFQSLDRHCAPETILASNTSSIPLTRIAAWTQRPQQVIGMHFMNPVPLMPLVEVIRGLATSDATWQTTMDLARLAGKTPVTVHDAPGFVSNRILMPMINEAVFALHEGVATAEDIDTVMKLGMNHPMGPLALADLIGLDTCLSIMDVLYREFRDSKYRVCPLLAQKVAAGQLGKKSGQGFYTY
ncbi:MAG: 3-hydroxybutyryl-CoA dehydrogenase [Paludibacterium sp.]|uniref:3-hydroxybutyryl-CoA dehydrogenase n=1 Tax=Paludibacterium sp. TaxID=1917523 RepID=UPI0025DE2D13|nr:3-hydroxybutyryl-CoA dehydrogenase [Paludibacterium sp.]MBV8049302.1 3-hydroxybutyryl-CoA dehydrogenase [Paludibacterium sp.]MBV8648433.1 3-hydroxybutyryl-CoA dehydrogenase [Paludibacterium sp.]